MIGFDSDVLFRSSINRLRNQRVVLSALEKQAVEDLRVAQWDVQDNNVQCHETNKSFGVLYTSNVIVRTKE